MGYWDILLPEATTNYVDNPHFQRNVTDGWTLTGTAASKTRDGTRGWRGGVSCKLVAGSTATYMDSNTLAVPNGASVTVLAWVYRETAVAMTLVIRDTTASTDRASAAPTKTGKWEEVTVSWTNNTGGSKTVAVRLTNDGDVTDPVWIGAVQMELSAYATTFCAGDEPGCTWDKEPFNSPSTRSAEYRMGGRWRNLADDYNVEVEASLGIGVPPLSHQTQQQAFLDGALFRGVKVLPRPLTLHLAIGSLTNKRSGLHALRRDLIDALKPDLVADEDEETPAALFALRYSGALDANGAGELLELTHLAYVSGLELDARTQGYLEKTALQMIAYDPYFYELGDEGLSFSAVTDTLEVNHMIRYWQGAWDNYGDPAGSPGPIYAIARAPNGDIYFGGNFTNWAGLANADYLVRWSEANQAFEALASGGIDFVVHALYFDGGTNNLYIGGAFTNPHDYFMRYSVSGNTFHAITGGPDNNVRCLLKGPDGKLYIGGEFTTRNGGGTTVNYIMKMDLRTYAFTTMDGGVNSTVLALAVSGGRYVWVGGSFTTVGTGAAASQRLAAWSIAGSGSWAVTFASGCNSSVHALATENINAGWVYVGGAFTTFKGQTVNYVVKVNDSGGWEALASGVNDDVHALSVLENRVFLAGAFTEASGITLANRVCQYLGGVFAPFDVTLPGTGIVYAFFVHPSQKDFILGGDFSGTATFSSFDTSAPANNSGSRATYPVLRLRAEGGDSVLVRWLKNLRTGRTILFDYPLGEGEELTVDFRPGQRKVVSSALGELSHQPLPGSDLARFLLLPGENNLAILIDTTGSPTITAELFWRPRHWSADGGAA